MLIPVRCFTCGKVVGNKWDSYVKKLQDGTDETAALNELGLTRPCCRRMLLTHVDLLDRLLKFNAMDETQTLPEALSQGLSQDLLQALPQALPEALPEVEEEPE